MRHEFNCDQCGQDKVHDSPISTGYGLDEEGNKICFECCGINDRRTMVEDGNSKRLPLYLNFEGAEKELTNWPGSLRFSINSFRNNSHNIAQVRRDVWFDGPDGHVWHGVQLGNNSQICHCKRTKQLTEA